MISDRDLLCYFKPEPEGIWPILSKIKHPFKHETIRTDLQRRLEETKAAAVMIVDLITVSEDMLIEEAIELMINKKLKRLPVTDANNRFKGMISRDSLLRSGFGGPV